MFFSDVMTVWYHRIVAKTVELSYKDQECKWKKLHIT